MSSLQQYRKQSSDEALIDALKQFYADPLGFVIFAYPWGKVGTPLEQFKGPDADQRDFLKQVGEEVRKRRFDGVNPVDPLLFGRSSGRGTGKTARAAWLVDWLMSTRKDAVGTVTANTNSQLQTKTWAAIRHWTSLCITAHWWQLTSQRMEHKRFPASWFCVPQTCKEENRDSFLGQHAITSSQFYVFDEASGISDKIFEAARSGLTDGEPHMYIFGNPTRRNGQLFRACFGSERHRWNHGVIDSRNSSLSNKTEIEKAIEDYGADSDYVRVWIKGLPPSAADLQFIDADRVYSAQSREAIFLEEDALIVGVDVARGGEDNNVFRFRRGRDARSISPIKIPGEHTRDTMIMVAKIIDVLETPWNGRKPDAIFVDGTGVGGGIVDRCRQMGHEKVIEVQFGAKATDDEHYANMRAYMWGRMKDWLAGGAIEPDLTSETDLETDLTGPCFYHDKKGRIQLEPKEAMKKRGLSSPDDGDALALTFAYPVAQQKTDFSNRFKDSGVRDGSAWMGN